MPGERLLLVDEPFVSDHLRRTIERHGLPVVLTEAARSLGFEPGPHTVEESEAIRRARHAAAAGERLLVYTVSENSIGWIARHLGETGLPATVDAFKDKARFRRLIAGLYPDFWFREVDLGELGRLDADIEGGLVPLPFVIKPRVGFFSMGVHTVSDPREWVRVRETIRTGVDSLRGVYPDEVLSATSFLLEEQIAGDELALDAYFDAEGAPVILSIWRRTFASAVDTGDRLYTTSREIVASHLEEVTAHLSQIGDVIGKGVGEEVGVRVADIPVHVELRRRDDGTIVPVEVNPLRFGGWCTTADLTPHAFGFDPYFVYFEQIRPDWPAILDRAEGDAGTLYSIIVLDNTTGLDHRAVATFDYERLLTMFSKPLEIRRVDHRRYPLFGFVFVETPPGEADELDRILRSDLRDLITVAR